MRILALNAGSRSHRAQLFALDDAPPLDPPAPQWQGADESSDGSFSALLERYDPAPPDAVVHRFVHPGEALASRVGFLIDAHARRSVEQCDLAPSHNPLALEGLRAASARFPHALQIGVSDIALRADAPNLATRYAVPGDWYERFGVRRYGFHGISHRDALERNAALCGEDDAERRTISVHLGSGASLVAARGRTIVDSTMGMTPFEGIVMGSRSGSIDPGIIFTLVRRGVMTLDEIEGALGKNSGLLGVSGVSSDTRELAAAVERGDERARFALELYAYSARKAIGAFAAALGGLDVLSFTGPVGEHVAALREQIVLGLDFLGIALDTGRNRSLAREGSIARDTSIGAGGSTVRVHVVRTLEEWAMAREALRQARQRFV